MPDIRVMILRAAGTNCDLECQHAWQLAGASPERIHIRRLIENPALLNDYQILTIPGGFSYGDDISAGRIFAGQLERHLLDDLRSFVARGRLILGVCNGFQVLVKAGLLPYSQSRAGRDARHADSPLSRDAPARAALDARDDPSATRVCTVTHNDPPGFQDRWVWLRADSSKCIFLEPGRNYEMPIAHGEGRVLFRDASALDALVRNDQCALRYVSPPYTIDTTVTVGTDAELAASTASGAAIEARLMRIAGIRRLAPDTPLLDPPDPAQDAMIHEYIHAPTIEDTSRPGASIDDILARAPCNPNGSTADLAGLCDETGRVFGLMPHPDRFTEWTQHPCWTSLPARAEGDGLAIFRRAVEHLR